MKSTSSFVGCPGVPSPLPGTGGDVFWLDLFTPDPAKAAAHYQLGDAYNQTDRLNDALEAYESAVRLQPDHWRAMKGIGVVLDRLGRPVEATAAYQKARDAQKR